MDRGQVCDLLFQAELLPEAAAFSLSSSALESCRWISAIRASRGQRFSSRTHSRGVASPGGRVLDGDLPSAAAATPRSATSRLSGRRRHALRPSGEGPARARRTLGAERRPVRSASASSCERLADALGLAQHEAPAALLRRQQGRRRGARGTLGSPGRAQPPRRPAASARRSSSWAAALRPGPRARPPPGSQAARSTALSMRHQGRQQRVEVGGLARRASACRSRAAARRISHSMYGRRLGRAARDTPRPRAPSGSVSGSWPSGSSTTWTASPSSTRMSRLLRAAFCPASSWSKFTTTFSVNRRRSRAWPGVSAVPHVATASPTPASRARATSRYPSISTARPLLPDGVLRPRQAVERRGSSGRRASPESSGTWAREPSRLRAPKATTFPDSFSDREDGAVAEAVVVAACRLLLLEHEAGRLERAPAEKLAPQGVEEVAPGVGRGAGPDPLEGLLLEAAARAGTRARACRAPSRACGLKCSAAASMSGEDLLALLAVGPGSYRFSGTAIAEAARHDLDGLREARPLVEHHELEDVAALAAAEAVEEPRARSAR